MNPEKYIKSIVDFLIQKNWFESASNQLIVYLIIIGLFFGSCFLAYWSVEHNEKQQIMFNKFYLIPAILIIFTLLMALTTKIKFLYTNNIHESKINKTIETFLKTIFPNIDSNTSNKSLLANYYKLSTFLKVIKNDNKSYIVFGKIDKETYWSIYTQFCSLATRVMWTKNQSLMNKNELINILDKYKIEHNDHDVCHRILKHHSKSLTTTYDAEFLKASGVKDRIFVVDSVPKDLSLETYNDFLNLIQTQEEVLNSKELNSYTKAKRIKDFIGDSNIFVIGKDELKRACSIAEDETLREFGIYEIDNSLYTLKTRVSDDEWYVTIEVEASNRDENEYSKFFKKYRNTKKLATHTIGTTAIKIHHIKEVA